MVGIAGRLKVHPLFADTRGAIFTFRSSRGLPFPRTDGCPLAAGQLKCCAARGSTYPQSGLTNLPHPCPVLGVRAYQPGSRLMHQGSPSAPPRPSIRTLLRHSVPSLRPPPRPHRRPLARRHPLRPSPRAKMDASRTSPRLSTTSPAPPARPSDTGRGEKPRDGPSCRVYPELILYRRRTPR